MNVPNLARRLAARIIEGLQGRGRIVVVRGGTSALVRAIDDVITAFVTPIITRLEREQFPAVDQQTREELTLLASAVARALLSSEHLEDVFADRSILEREVFDAAMQLLAEASAEELAHVIQIELDLLGYVAATAGRLASEEQVLDALERAAISLDVKVSHYDFVLREAVFELGEDQCLDLRLELEEAVADELCALVVQGLVRLPVMERTRPLVHQVGLAHRARLTRMMDRAASRTLRRTGCSAQWELPDDRSVRVVFTPLSEQDARDIDTHVAAFAAELDTILADAGAPLVAASLSSPQIVEASHHNGSEKETEPMPDSAPEPVMVAKRAPRSGMRAKAAPRVPPKRTTTKRAKRAEVSVPEKSEPRTKTSAKRSSAPKKTRAAKKG